MSEWISVKDRLPKPYTALMFFGKFSPMSGYSPYVGCYDGKKWCSDVGETKKRHPLDAAAKTAKGDTQ